MMLFLSRFAKTASLFMMSVALLLSLSVNVFADGGGTVTYSNYYFFSGNQFTRLSNSSGGADLSNQNFPSGSQIYYGADQSYSISDFDDSSPYVQIDLSYSFLSAAGPPYKDSAPFILKFAYDGNFQESPSIPFGNVMSVNVLNSSFESVGNKSGVCSFVLTSSEFRKLLNFNLYHLNLLYLVEPKVYETSSTYAMMVQTVKQTWTTNVEFDPTIANQLDVIAGKLDDLSYQLGYQLGNIDDKLGNIDDKLGNIDSAINADLVDSSDIASIDSSIADHSAADAAVNDALQDILDMVVYDSDGNPIPLTFDSGYIQNLATLYNFDLSGFAVTNAASIFRHTLAGYITQFGAFIFFPLVLGIIGALMGRPSGA